MKAEFGRLRTLGRTRRPWLSVSVSPWWARVLVAAGAQSGSARFVSTARVAIPRDNRRDDRATPQRVADEAVDEESIPMPRQNERPVRRAVPVRASAARQFVRPGLVVSVGVAVVVLTVALLVRAAISSTMNDDNAGYGNGLGPQTATAPAPPAPISDPASVVDAYYAAINQHDYQTAWNLGGKNLGQPYATFVKSFTNIAEELVVATNRGADTVAVNLTVVQTNGKRTTYAGTFTVTGGIIQAAGLQRWTGS